MVTKNSRYNYDPFSEPEQSREVVSKERRMTVATLKSQAAYPPLTDVERIARHYGISVREACEWLKYHTVDELLPERGTGAETGTRRPRPKETYPITLNPVSQIVLDGFEIKDVDVFAAEQGPLGLPPPFGLETRITSIEAGQKFDIHCQYWIKNTRVGSWRTCATVYNTTRGSIVDADPFIRLWLPHTWNLGRDRIAGVVINEPTTFEVKLFANQEIGEARPPTDIWA